MEIDSRINQVAQCDHKCPYTRKAGGPESEREDVRLEAEVGEEVSGQRRKATSHGTQAPTRSRKGKGAGAPGLGLRKERSLPTA